MFIPTKDKIDNLYASLQAYFKIEDDGELKKYLGIELDQRPDGSMHLWHPYLIQTIINIIPDMDKSSANITPAVNPTLMENKGSQTRKK